ncbi:MAG: diaminopimelate decarboxylase [Actinomycetota bacterium]
MTDELDAGSSRVGSSLADLADRARRPSAWPASASIGAQGLEIGGAACIDLAARFGTPLLIVDEADLRARCRAVATRFDRVLYAVKAFTAHAAIRIALDEGLDLLASTGGEVEACLRAGARADRIVLHGNNKSDDELRLAIEARLSLVIADGAPELERLDAIARRANRVQPVLLRIVPEVVVRTHEAIATGHEASKFGTRRSEAVAVARLAASSPGLRFDGLHAHIGSQVPTVESYERSLDALLGLVVQLREAGVAPVRVLDLGGGFAVPYVDEPGLDPGEVAETLYARLSAWAAEEGFTPPALIAEPGRTLVANPGVTLYTVGARKEAGGHTLVAVDGGMSDNLRPMLYDARFQALAADRPPARSEPTVPMTIVGKHCESGDVLAEDVALPPDIGPGDLVALAATGAYTYSLATAYNRVGRPSVVAVREGVSTLWLRREDAADMDRFETAAARPVIDARVPEGITVRPARPRDATSFVALWQAVVDEGRFVRSETVAHPTRVYRARFRRSWTDHDAQLVAVEGDRVVGHLYIQRERHPVTRHVATLGISVAPDRRGNGIGATLLGESIRWATAVGVDKIVLSVYPHNTAAISLYRRFGFVDEGRLARQSRRTTGDVDEILMGLWLGG